MSKKDELIEVKTVELRAELVPTLAYADLAFAHRYKDVIEPILVDRVSGRDQPHILIPLDAAGKLRDSLSKELAE